MGEVESIDNKILKLKKAILDLRARRSDAKAREQKKKAYERKRESENRKRAAAIVRDRQKKNCDNNYPKAQFSMTNGF